MMKVCPRCKMTVSEIDQCPICSATITYEPLVNSDKEKYIFNKYYFSYLLKKAWFPVVCLLVVICNTFFFKAPFTVSDIPAFIGATAALSLGLFQRKIILLEQEITFHYVPAVVYTITSAFLGIGAVIASFII